MSDELHNHLERIKVTFPDVSWDQAKLITREHHTVILDDSFVFRFPREASESRRLRREVRLMRFLAPRLSLPVPDYSYVPPDSSFAGYELIPGEPLNFQEFIGLPTSERSRFESEIARFLTELHAVSADALRRLQVANAPPPPRSPWRVGTADWKEQVRMARVEARSSGLAGLTQRIDSFVAELDHAGQHEFAVLLHTDLGASNILSRGDGKIAGIIDFSELRIGDPAADFYWLWDFGPQTVARVYRSYQGPKDDDFLRRSLCYEVLGVLAKWYRSDPGYEGLRGERAVTRRLREAPDQLLSEALK